MDTEKEKTVTAFDAELQKDTPHTMDVDGNGEVVLTSTESGHFIKFPRGTSAEQIREYLAVHKGVNEGQVTEKSIEEEKAKIIEALTDEIVQ